MPRCAPGNWVKDGATDDMANNSTGGFSPLNWLPKRARSDAHCRISCGDECFQPVPNASGNEPFAAVLNRRISRRALTRAIGIGAPLMAISTSALGSQLLGGAPLAPKAEAAFSSVGIESIPNDMEDAVNLSPGYGLNVLIRWGDPVLPGAPRFSLAGQSADAAAKQFGFNCDYNGFFPLYAASNDRGLLVVNHEYTSGSEMFPDWDEDAGPTPEQVAIQIANHGASVIEVQRLPDGRWTYRSGSQFNRRITGTTPLTATGPAAGSALLQTASDPTGMNIAGMFNNCAGGKTPWGTALTCEENFNVYFANWDALSEAERAGAGDPGNRYLVPGGASRRGWEAHEDRFDLAKAGINEANRYGYVVEIDPSNPNSVPRKHTALGRFKHEAANTTLADDGRAVVYSGDDQRFDYVYKFVSDDRFDPFNREANLGLLESGTLYVARFNDEGDGEWIPLVPEGPLAGWTPTEIAVRTRQAADLVGATPMDRPEDIEVNPVNRRVYIALTNNSRRRAEQINGANPLGPNTHGHILELTETGGDAAAQRFTWDVFIICGNAEDEEDVRYFAGFDRGQLDSLSSPDNFAFDNNGNLWIATDGQDKINQADAIYVVPTSGRERGRVRRFMTGVPGGEIVGPEFTPDYRTLFAGIQHPGEGDGLAEPGSRWPDGDFPRPSVVAVRKLDDGVIGT